MKFQFQTTAHKFAEDSKWGSWIYGTNTLRQVSIGTILVLFALLMPGSIIFVEIAWSRGATWPVALGAILLCAVMCGVFIPGEVTWKRWKKEFLKVDALSPQGGGEDEAMTVTFTEEGCEVSASDGPYERFQWKKIVAIRESAETWDFMDHPGLSGLSVRKTDLVGGEAEAFSAFVQEKSKKKIKPRAIERSELRHRFLR